MGGLWAILIYFNIRKSLTCSELRSVKLFAIVFVLALFLKFNHFSLVCFLILNTSKIYQMKRIMVWHSDCRSVTLESYLPSVCIWPSKKLDFLIFFLYLYSFVFVRHKLHKGRVTSGTNTTRLKEEFSLPNNRFYICCKTRFVRI